ncbi:MAG: AAA family ATPase [Candidatus Promineifilaceae bacterium]|nr:AAA family ATPase [Candidatus Promineifilaceae bacterium]
MLSQWHVEEMVELLRRRYPAWDGFDHPPFVADEVQPKQQTVEKARELLSESALMRLLTAWRYDELIDRLEQLGRDSNLLWNRVPQQGDLAILYHPRLERAEFGLQMRQLLYGRALTAQRVQQFSRYASRQGLPNRWPFPTYFLFLTHPERELFIRPQIARWFLQFVGLANRYTPYPNGDLYATLLEQALALRSGLAPFGPRDMVDVQSFLWVAARESDRHAAGLDVWGQVELDVPATAPVSAYQIGGAGSTLREGLPEGAETAGEVSVPTVGELLEPLFQAFKLLGGAAAVGQLEEKVAEILALSPAQQRVRQKPAHSSPRKLAYRLGWARTRLKNRGLIENVERGFWQLTEQGREADFAEDAERARAIQEAQSQPQEDDAVVAAALQMHERRASYGAPAYAVELHPPYPLAELASDTGYSEKTLQLWLQGLARKGQIIFYGPPGTGKTFLARRLARHLVGGSDGIVDIVQFHPAYTYEDFMQGIRPVTGPDGTLQYEMVAGRFLRFCEVARERQGHCVLIVDEINRANLARVFGELMYLLEYREQAIPLAAGGLFSIPANVRLIGTMNTADRSTAVVDHALRRRFAFVSLPPNFDLLRRYHEEHETAFPVEPLIQLLHRVNDAIDDPHYALGITPFLLPDLGVQIADIWRMEIEPYLEELFFDRQQQLERFRWENVRGPFMGAEEQ